MEQCYIDGGALIQFSIVTDGWGPNTIFELVKLVLEVWLDYAPGRALAFAGGCLHADYYQIGTGALPHAFDPDGLTTPVDNAMKSTP